MTYFVNRDRRPFQLLDDFKFKAPAYVISYWMTGIDSAFLRNEAFNTRGAMLDRIAEIRLSKFGSIYSDLRWRYIKRAS